jgi:hypothetical protein
VVQAPGIAQHLCSLMLIVLSLYYLLCYKTVIVIVVGALIATVPTHTPHIVNGANTHRTL